MNNLCTALADALRKVAEKYPEVMSIDDEFETDCILMSVKVGDGWQEWNIWGMDHPEYDILDMLDAVAAALGMEFEVGRMGSGGWVYFVFAGAKRFPILPVIESRDTFPDKRSASLAALYAIITHVLEDGK